MTKIDLESLPKDIQDAIAEANREPEPLFPLKPREFINTHMQTKEFVEITRTVDLLIQAVNQLHEDLSNR